MNKATKLVPSPAIAIAAITAAAQRTLFEADFIGFPRTPDTIRIYPSYVEKVLLWQFCHFGAM
jgi:hypothetical protein